MFKEVRLHKREEMGNKRLGGLLLRQAIHSSSKELQKSRAEIGEWKSEDGKMNVARREMICRHHILYCTITSCLSDSEIRAIVQPSHKICLLIFYEGSLPFNIA